jgi:hypothetical protein
MADNRTHRFSRQPRPRPSPQTHSRRSRHRVGVRCCRQAKDYLLEVGVVKKEEHYEGGVPLLSVAALTCWDGGVELLLEYGANVTATALDDSWTALAFACIVRAEPPAFMQGTYAPNKLSPVKISPLTHTSLSPAQRSFRSGSGVM